MTTTALLQCGFIKFNWVLSLKICFRLSIVEHLRIPDGLDGVISDIPLPDNLTLTISCDDNRDLALMRLLKAPRFVEYQSIIIYCSRRDECERVAKNLRTYFQVIIFRLFCGIFSHIQIECFYLLIYKWNFALLWRTISRESLNSAIQVESENER